MNANGICEKLDRDFIRDGIRDIGWAGRMPALEKYLHPVFVRNGGMGLMCDFAKEVQKVYTTVFLSDKVLSKVLDDDVSDAMIFSHHPMQWDLENHDGLYPADAECIAKLKKRNVSVYVLHHPLDNYGPYSTCGTLADRLGLRVETPAFGYFGAMCGVVCAPDCRTIGELHERFSRAVGHETRLYPYGDADIRGRQIAICPGGGNDMFVVREMLERNVKILMTGVTIVNDHSQEEHAFEEARRINVLGGTHYSTEKYAPMAMCGYFRDLGLPCEFVEDEAGLNDL